MNSSDPSNSEHLIKTSPSWQGESSPPTEEDRNWDILVEEYFMGEIVGRAAGFVISDSLPPLLSH
jgi:hypothetical protein